MVYVRMLITMFESLVNTEGFKTIYSRSPGQYMFEEDGRIQNRLTIPIAHSTV